MDINEIQKCPITVDKLVGDGGNWKVVYVYHNWGSHPKVMFLLPYTDFDHDSEEDKINAAVTAIPDGVFEEARMLNDWCAEYPDSPFIIMIDDQTGGFLECAKMMEDNLAKYNGDWDKFLTEAAEFDKWRKVAYYVSNTDGAEYAAWHEGWRSLIDAAGAGDKD